MQNQKITIEMIETKEFHVAARGYNQHEVDEFLDSICDEFERMENEINALKEEKRVLEQRPKGFAEPAATEAPAAPVAAPAGADRTFREILEMAQRVKDQTIADAEAKAEEIVRNAETEVKARLGNLAEEKENLEKDLETFKAAAKAYKEKFADLLTMAQDALNAAEEL